MAERSSERLTASRRISTTSPRSSRGSALSNSEYEPLLPDVLEPSLYKTISNTSQIPPDNASVDNEEGAPPRTATGIYTTLSVLLLGVFVSQTDQSFVLATYGAVSSEFNDLRAGSWLISAFILAQCVAQPLYGKMSDIYGRKACLQTSYLLFALGTAMSGLGRSMGQVIVGRAVQGAGGAGMVSMVQIIITDLVPLHEVATMWSYVNILQTTGRSCGGFIGGLLTQSLGWRWAFLIQAPPVLLGSLIVQWQLKLPNKTDEIDQSKWEKLKRVDFVGAIFLCFAIFAATFVIDVGGQKLPWDSPTLIGIMAGGVVSAGLFVVAAKRHPEPIFPLRLIAHYDLVTNYTIIVLQTIIQMSLMISVPLFFQAVKNATTGAAGAYLIPAFVGNAVGGLAAGFWIKKTGVFKWPTVTAPVLSICCLLLCLTWDKHTNVFQSLFIFFGGCAMGMVSNSAFTGIAAAVAPEDVAIAGSGMFLFFNVGAITGASSGSAVYQTSLKSNLGHALRNVEGGIKIRRRLMEDISYLRTVSDKMRDIVLPAYVESFHNVMILGLICAGLSLIVAIFSRGKRLTRKMSVDVITD